MDNMKELKVWQCQWCKKLFKTPNRHCCKKNPALKNCFTCKHLKDWYKDDYGLNAPNCVALEDKSWLDWDIESIKSMNYDMKCECWEQGEFSWAVHHGKEEKLLMK